MAKPPIKKEKPSEHTWALARLGHTESIVGGGGHRSPASSVPGPWASQPASHALLAHMYKEEIGQGCSVTFLHWPSFHTDLRGHWPQLKTTVSALTVAMCWWLHIDSLYSHDTMCWSVTGLPWRRGYHPFQGNRDGISMVIWPLGNPVLPWRDILYIMFLVENVSRAGCSLGLSDRLCVLQMDSSQEKGSDWVGSHPQ